MEFVKMHGAGNDYIFVNGVERTFDWPRLAVLASDRHKGIGGDGLIVAERSGVADLKMSMFNIDGSQGAMCGNGIRCLVKFEIGEGIVSANNPVVKVETGRGVLEVFPIIEDQEMVGAKVAMGVPMFNPGQIPLKIDMTEGPILDYDLRVDGFNLGLSFVSMGNGHAVTFLEGPVEEFPLGEIGPKVELQEIFPDRINFEIVNVVSDEHIKVRVWERGSGITMACGTGACAASVIARLRGMVKDDVTVEMPGGILKTSWDGSGTVMMEGPVETVFRGEWDFWLGNLDGLPGLLDVKT